MSVIRLKTETQCTEVVKPLVGRYFFHDGSENMDLCSIAPGETATVDAEDLQAHLDTGFVEEVVE